MALALKCDAQGSAAWFKRVDIPLVERRLLETCLATDAVIPILDPALDDLEIVPRICVITLDPWEPTRVYDTSDIEKWLGTP